MSLILDGTNGLSDVDGTAAAPAIRGTDTNTGIFFGTDTIGFAEGGTEVMRIDSSGNVGIGTSSPNSKLTSQTATTSTSVFSFATQLNNSYGSNDSIAALGFHNRADVNATGVGGAIAFSGGGTSAGSGNLIFCIKGTGGIGNVVAPSDEKMRITSDGDVFIGATSAINADKLGITFNGLNRNGIVLKTTYASTGSDFAQFYNSAGTAAGRITQNGTTTVAYTTSSDYRLKEAIAPMTGALAKVAALNPVSYKWKSDGSDSQGFIAHELQAVVPECVTGEKDATETVEVKDENGNVTNTEVRPVYQGIDTSFLVATLTAAIQELHALVKTQDSTITALTTRITALEAA